MRPLATLALAILLGICAVPAAVRADGTTASPPHGRFYLGIGPLLRLTQLDPASDAYDATLDVYQYEQRSPRLWGLSLFGAWRATRYLDLGATSELAYIRHGQPRGEDTDLTTNLSQLGGFARLHTPLAPAIDLGLRLESGALRANTELRGEHVTAVMPYLRAEVDTLIGADRTGVRFHAGWLSVRAGDAYGDSLRPPLEGLEVGAAIFHRF